MSRRTFASDSAPKPPNRKPIIQNPQSAAALQTHATPADPNLNAWLTFANGATAILQPCDVRAYTIFELNLLGTLGRLRLLSHGFEVEFDQVCDHPRYTGYKGLRRASPPQPNSENARPRDAVCPSAAPSSPTFAHASETPLLYAMENLARCLDSGREPLSSGRDGLAALEVIAALLESADHNGIRIALPVKNRTRCIGAS